MQIPKKIAVINDLAGYGRCSLAISLPVISAMKVQACPVPTSLFSNHTAFPTFHFTDFTKQMPDYLAAWDLLSLSFDGILCGFLGSMEQIRIVEHFLDSQKRFSPMILIDPVMGDHGKAYRTITPEHCGAMKSLVKKADIITPNLTEACLLTDTPYPETSPSAETLNLLCERLHIMGPASVVITGIYENAVYVNQIYTQGRCFQYAAKEAGESRHGTGDLFASIIAADAVKGEDFTASVQKAADFVRTCTNASSQAKVPVNEGVCFEPFLSMLT